MEGSWHGRTGRGADRGLKLKVLIPYNVNEEIRIFDFKSRHLHTIHAHLLSVDITKLIGPSYGLIITVFVQ